MDEHSAGAITVHKHEYLLLHYPAGHWDFAKGHIEAGETPRETALRELEEETGLSAALINGFEGSVSYFYKKQGKSVHKTVDWFIAEVQSKDVRLSHEHKGFLWLPFTKAHHKLTFKNSKDQLERAQQFLKSLSRIQS